MKKTRIVERKNFTNGFKTYTIQVKHGLFFWHWVDGWLESSAGAWCTDTFDTVGEAMLNIPAFGGSKYTTKVIYAEGNG
jgi:hypothetical protein